MSTHLRQVHKLYGDERKKRLGGAGFSIKHYSGLLPGRPTHTLKEMRYVRKNTSSVLKPFARKVKASMVTKLYPDLNFCQKFSLSVVDPTENEKKNYFVQQIFERNVSCRKCKKVFSFIGITINCKNVMKLEKTSGSKKVCLSRLKNCVKLIPGTTTSSS